MSGFLCICIIIVEIFAGVIRIVVILFFVIIVIVIIIIAFISSFSAGRTEIPYFCAVVQNNKENDADNTGYY